MRCWRWRTNNPPHRTRFYENTKTFLKQSSREFRDVAIEELLGTKDKSLPVGAKVVDGISNNPDDNFMVALFADHWLR